MRTARLLPVSPSMHCSWGYLAGEVYLPGGVYLPEGGVVYLPGGGCVCPATPPRTDLLTHATEEITLPQTSFAGGNHVCYKSLKNEDEDTEQPFIFSLSKGEEYARGHYQMSTYSRTILASFRLRQQSNFFIQKFALTEWALQAFMEMGNPCIIDRRILGWSHRLKAVRHNFPSLLKTSLPSFVLCSFKINASSSLPAHNWSSFSSMAEKRAVLIFSDNKSMTACG